MVFGCCAYIALSLVVLAVLFSLPYIAIKIRSLKELPDSILKGKAVLITGCDTGFGYKTSQKLAKNENLTVFAGCLTNKGLEDLKSVAPPNLVPFLLDVTSQESVDAAYDFVKNRLSGKGSSAEGLLALINNAGILRAQIIEAAFIEDMKLMFNVNVVGMAMMVKKFLPLLRATKNSRIINVASVAGRLANAGTAAYSASKFAVEAYSDALRREMSPWGVKVVIIEPGIMKTPLYATSVAGTTDKLWGHFSEEVKEAYGREFFDELHRTGAKVVDVIGGNPEQVVDAMAWTVTSENPPHRLSVGYDAPAWIFISYLPSWLSDPILRVIEPNKAVPAGLQKRTQ